MNLLTDRHDGNTNVRKYLQIFDTRVTIDRAFECDHRITRFLYSFYTSDSDITPLYHTPTVRINKTNILR